VKAPIFDIGQFLDECAFGKVQRRVLWICALIGAAEGFDAQAVSYIAPTLSADWKLPPGALGPVFSLGLFGLMLGALCVAPLADRVGRRPLLIGNLIIFGTGTLFTALAPNLTALMALRFLTGLGLGGAMPNAVSLTSEYMPSRRRGFLVMLMFNGFNAGSMLGGILSARFVGSLGWQAVFAAGGLLSLLLVPIVFFLLPESAAFLALNATSRERLIRILRRLDPSVRVDDGTLMYVARAPMAAKIAVRQLFAQGRGAMTLLIWTVFFLSLLDIYLLVSWLPTALNAGGASVRNAIVAGIVLQLGSVVGCFPIGWALDRFGAPVAMTCAYLGGGACIAAIGAFSGNLPLTLGIAFAAGFGLIGGQAAANALAAMSYPTEVRSTGVGWALGIGRIGSILGPLIGAGLLMAGTSTAKLFMIVAIPAVLAGLAVAALGALGAGPLRRKLSQEPV
jgi:AAHS family 4-hydroxybenzoate transporter-like MFS transporter